jgi:alpha-N-arabinofuranosidase
MRRLEARAALVGAVLVAAACATTGDPEFPANAQPRAKFDWFEYAGGDAVHEERPARADEYANPILAGFYPDPSITRVGDDYYLVTSTFAYFPGIPVFRSRDLVDWTQIGNAIDRPDMLDFTGLGLSRGVFAPTIAHHGGVFYIANTCVDCGGNYIITARDPAGPWSDPVWLPEVGGIDPSLFFDDDGTLYLMNNNEPPGGSTYDGHRAIWIRAIDPTTFQSISEPRAILDGGVRPEEKPIWIEGPHIYRLPDGYLLSAAEGGTSTEHSQVVLRADSVLGPWTPYEGNPILTQRHLDPERPRAVTAAGHADFVELPDGSWWATFLAIRPYAEGHFNTGRETFLMPVRWKDGWPVITEGDETIPYVHERPGLPRVEPASPPMSGAFVAREEFDGSALAPSWMMIRTPRENWIDLAASRGALTLTARSEPLGGGGQPSFIGRRLQHQRATARTRVRFAPEREGDLAGLAALQSDAYFYLLAVAAGEEGPAVRLFRRAGPDDPAHGVEVASAPLGIAPGEAVDLAIEADGGSLRFSYATREGEWTTLLDGADGTLLSTETAGGFVGAVLGLYAYAEPR